MSSVISKDGCARNKFACLPLQLLLSRGKGACIVVVARFLYAGWTHASIQLILIRESKMKLVSNIFTRFASLKVRDSRVALSRAGAATAIQQFYCGRPPTVFVRIFRHVNRK